MDVKSFLNKILTELQQIGTSENISREKLVSINESIASFQNQYAIENLPEDESDLMIYDEDYRSSNDDSLYNRPDFNHDLDIDQQGPDFDF